MDDERLEDLEGGEVQTPHEKGNSLEATSARESKRTILILEAQSKALRIAEDARRARMKARMKQRLGEGIPHQLANLVPEAGHLTWKWYPERCEEMYNLLTDPEGAHSEYSAGVYMDVPPDTIREWVKKYPEFRTAIAVGKVIQSEMMARKLAAGMAYGDGLKWVMKNRHPEEFKDKNETEHHFTLSDIIKRQEEQAEASRVDWDKPLLDAVIVDTTASAQAAEGGA